MIELSENAELRISGYSRWLGRGIAAVGMLVLSGWVADIPALKSVLPGFATMKPNTAAAFVLSGICLSVLGGGPRATSPTHRLAAHCLAALTGTLGLLTLGEYAFGWHLGIDQMLIHDPSPHLSGRMAPMTALNFALLASALLLLDNRTRGGQRPSQWLAVFVAGNSFVALLGYLYGVAALYRIAAASPVALHTTLLFLAASVAVLLARPESAFVRLLAAASAGGVIVRRLLPAAVLVPPLLGWLRWLGELAGYYGTAFGLALYATSNVAIFTALAWWTARAVERLEVQTGAVSRISDWRNAILESADFTVISTDPDGVIRTINTGAARKLGYTTEELLGQTPVLIHDRAEVAARAQVLSQLLGQPVEPGFESFVALARRGGSDENDWTYIRKDGSRFWVRLSVTALHDGEGKLTGFVGIGKDITAQKTAEGALRDSEARLRLITDNLPAAIAHIDVERRFTFNNQTHARWLGRSVAALKGQHIEDCHPPELYRQILPHVDAAFGGRRSSFEVEADGHHFRATYVPEFSEAGTVVGVYALVDEITKIKKIEAELRQMAEFDALTGLANRRRFDDRLDDAIARSERSGQGMGLMFMDLDRFKQINDGVGHKAGDQVLQEFAKRISGCVRRTDTVARLAGDEFVVILEPLASPGDAKAVAEKILRAMDRPFEVDSGSLQVTTSIGVALRGPREIDGEALLRRADQALYAVKAEQRGKFKVTGATPEG